MILDWLAREIGSRLVTPPVVVELKPVAAPVQIHDSVTLRPGDKINLLNRIDKASGPAWFLLDCSSFMLGTAELSIKLLYAERESNYYTRVLSSEDVSGSLWDISLPPSDGIVITLELQAGRNTEFFYHYYSYPFDKSLTSI